MKETFSGVLIASLLALSSSSADASGNTKIVLSGFSDRLQSAVFSVNDDRNIVVSSKEQVPETTWIVDFVAAEHIFLSTPASGAGGSHVGLILRRGETLPEASEVQVKEPIRYFIEGTVSDMGEIDGQIQIDQKSGNDQW